MENVKIHTSEIKNKLKGLTLNEEIIASTIIENEKYYYSAPFFFEESEGDEQQISSFFAEIYKEEEVEVKSNFIQSFNVQDETDGSEYNIRLHENYVDSGSVDYCYSFTIQPC